ncbi:MAG: substrate-binding domain-containing protein, partial [Verrucomicrobiota bacterium]
MKYRAIWSLALTVISLAFTACSPEPSSSSGTRIAVIPKGTTHEFWQSIHAGAIKAQNELKEAGEDVEIIWQGPLKEDDREQQLQIVENFTVKRVSAIVLAPLDDQALVSPVRTATEAGIPVVVIDSGLKSDDYVSFVATDNYKGGVMAAEHMAELLGGQGNVMVLRYQVGSASTTKRENGFLETMAKHSGIKVISSDQYAGATRNKALDKSESLLNGPLGSQVN